MSRQRIVFFGSGAFGLPTLQSLRAQHEVVRVVTQPDRPAGRSRKLTPTPIGAWADEHELRADRVEDVNADEPLTEIRSIGADAWVVIAFGQKLSPALLTGRFAINLHASRLPRWRGAAPIVRAMLADERTTGNSVIALAERMDAGRVYAQSERAIDPNQTAGELHDALAADGPALVARVLEQHASGALDPIEQDDILATPAPKLRKTDGWVDFDAPAADVQRRVHALNPWPGVTVRFRDQALKLHRVATELAPRGETPGVVIDSTTGLIACADAAVRLVEVQPPGKRVMRYADWARGANIAPGEQLHGGQP